MTDSTDDGSRTIPCQACGGDGGHHDFGGNWGRCVTCSGSGEVEINLEPIGCAKCGAAVHSDDPQPGDWCMDCNMAFTPSENDFANKGKRIRALASGSVMQRLLAAAGWDAGSVRHKQLEDALSGAGLHITDVAQGCVMRAALERIAKQQLVDERLVEGGDYEYGYEQIVKIARAALAAQPPAAPAPDQAWRDSDWLGLSASEKACYHWPDDTDLHRQCRAAYVSGATDYAQPPAAPVEIDVLSHLVDWTYLHATEGETWPSSKTKADLITRARQDAPRQEHADAMKAEAPQRSSADNATAPFRFRRYHNGVEMAEGVQIVNASTVQDAFAKARAIYGQPSGMDLVLECTPTQPQQVSVPQPLYVLHEKHLCGYRVVLGFDTLDDAYAAHNALALSRPQCGPNASSPADSAPAQRPHE